MKSEERIQQEIFRWFHNTYPHLRGCLFHVPNGGERNGREAAKLKTMGVYPGVSDLILLYGGKATLIELKTETGTQSASQKKWELTMRGQGFEYVIFRTEKECIEFIKNKINGKQNVLPGM